MGGSLTWGGRRCAVATPGYGRNPLQGLGGWGGPGWVCELALSGTAFWVLALWGGVIRGWSLRSTPGYPLGPRWGRLWRGAGGWAVGLRGDGNHLLTCWGPRWERRVDGAAGADCRGVAEFRPTNASQATKWPCVDPG